MKFAKALAMGAVGIACGLAPAQAQTKAPPAPPKATQAEVAKVVADIKKDQAKMKQFCLINSLQDQYEAAGKAKDDKKLDELDKSMDAASAAIGPEFVKVTSADLDDASAKLLDDLAATCK
ncbi:MAG: hypothetical protein NW223_12885 [Hyphomicrobiaceae bacterium]|nr:hypothetical protein [Hyphomicrobiaceae bacterium]